MKKGHRKVMMHGFIAVGCIGLTLYTRPFAKIQFGPFYVLECLYFLALLAGLAQRCPLDFRKAGRSLWPAALFFAWGGVLLIGDLAGASQPWWQLPWNRIAQHALLFVYPLMWASMGFWMQQSDEGGTSFVVGGILIANVMDTALGLNVNNISLGTLIAVPFLAALQSLRSNFQWHRKIPVKHFLLVAFLAFLTFHPFWVQWTEKMQRTSLLILIAMILAVPWMLRREGQSTRIPIDSILISFVLLLAGFGAETVRNALAERLAPAFVAQTPVGTVEIKPTEYRIRDVPKAVRTIAIKTELKQTFLNTMQHGEDVPNNPADGYFQFRTRGFMWKMAVADWLHRPIVGIGFIPEFPSYVRPEVPNTGGFGGPGSPPVSGPHNSYLSVLGRMGIVGALIFVIFAVHWSYAAARVVRTAENWFQILPVVLVINGAIHAFFNAGFESPPRCMILWLMAGVVLGRSVAQNHDKDAGSVA